jgi:hypothetical protein
VRADERKEEAKIFYKNFIYKGKERSVRLMRECQQGTILLVQIYSPWLKCVEGWREFLRHVLIHATKYFSILGVNI